jgi:hypothetical protein
MPHCERILGRRRTLGEDAPPARGRAASTRLALSVDSPIAAVYEWRVRVYSVEKLEMDAPLIFQQ